MHQHQQAQHGRHQTAAWRGGINSISSIVWRQRQKSSQSENDISIV